MASAMAMRVLESWSRRGVASLAASSSSVLTAFFCSLLRLKALLMVSNLLGDLVVAFLGLDGVGNGNAGFGELVAKGRGLPGGVFEQRLDGLFLLFIEIEGVADGVELAGGFSRRFSWSGWRRQWQCGFWRAGREGAWPPWRRLRAAS